MNSLTELLGLTMFPIFKLLRKWRLEYRAQVIQIHITHLQNNIANDSAALRLYHARQALNNSELRNL